jgi:alanyl-tRNA synthetase
VADDIRIVEIDGFDYSACGGTHCAQTGAIGVLKIIKNERINNKTRIHFTAGYQALAQFREYHETLTNLSTQLSVAPIDLYPTTLQLIENQREVQKVIQSLRQQNINYEANQLLADSEILNYNHLIISISQNRPVSEIRMLAESIKKFPFTTSVLITYSNNRLSLMVTSTSNIQINAKNILIQLLTFINGKGGGDHQIAQGGGSFSEDDLHNLLTDGIKSVRQMLE